MRKFITQNTDGPRRTRMALLVACMIVLALPLFQTYTGLFGQIRSFEQRKLASKPVLSAWTYPAAVQYLQQQSGYFDDHHGFRNELIRLNNLVSFHLFRTSPVKSIIIGEDGWFYYDSDRDGNSFPDFYGHAVFTPAELPAVRKHLLTLKTEFSKRGICFLVVLSPNKQTIYPEYLPERIRKMKGSRTRADQLAEISSELDIPYLDLRPVFHEAMVRYPVELYHRLGTHWNQLGGFIAYTKIMEAIGKQFPALKPLPASDFRLTWNPVSTDAGCADIMGIRGTVPEGCFVMLPVVPQVNDIPAEDYTQKYAAYENKQDSGMKLLVFRDSFSSVLVRYLARHFSRSAFVWQFRVDFSIVDKETPDIVILQFAERYSGEFLR